MTTRRRLMLSAAILAGLIAVVLGVLAMLPSRWSLMKDRFDRIEVGMTYAEAKAIMGGLPDAAFDMPDGEVAGRAVLV